MTLRARLTLWYAAVLAGVLVLFGTAVYFMLSVSMTRQIEQALERTADDILRASQRNLGGFTVLPPLDLTANVYVEAFNASGTLVDRSANLTTMGQAFDPTELKATVRTFSSVEVGSVRFRVLTVPILVPPDQTIIGYLQLASSMETVVQARDMLLLLLIVGGVLAVAAAALVGGATARAALRPLNQVTETALQITRADDLSRRIPQAAQPSDEVGRLIQAFNESLERLESLFEAQRRFLADVSHELRTPLTSIRGNVDLIRRMGRPDPESLDAITSEVDRMTRMVQDLLLLAQAESGKLPLARDLVELDTLMLEVYQQAKILAQGKVEMRIGREDQARVLGDRDRLKQVLLNLVGNALEYTPPGGRVTLALSCVADWARLTVTDTGPGIPQEDLPHIFERFYRIDRSRRRTATGGAGLGLSIAYWITRSHQGRLEVASDVGNGSTFSIWLPLHNDLRLAGSTGRATQMRDTVENDSALGS
jgi:two-component system OmpR family sensor kinase